MPNFGPSMGQINFNCPLIAFSAKLVGTKMRFLTQIAQSASIARIAVIACPQKLVLVSIGTQVFISLQLETFPRN